MSGKAVPYVMSRWLAEGGQDKMRIHVNDLLALRERARHHSRDFKPEQKRAQRDQLLALRNKWITVKEAITVKHGKGTRKKVVNVSSPLIEIAIESEDDATGLISLPLD